MAGGGLREVGEPAGECDGGQGQEGGDDDGDEGEDGGFQAVEAEELQRAKATGLEEGQVALALLDQV